MGTAFGRRIVNSTAAPELMFVGTFGPYPISPQTHHGSSRIPGTRRAVSRYVGMLRLSALAPRRKQRLFYGLFYGHTPAPESMQ